MQILFNTDNNIDGHEGLSTHVTSVVEHALIRVRDHVARVTVHLSDENSSKGGKEDKRCVMEARMEGHQPVAVTHHAETLHSAADGAAHKLARLIESSVGRSHDLKARAEGLVEADEVPDVDEAA